MASFLNTVPISSPSNSVPSGVQGVCPVGWHVPSMDEWKKLGEYLEPNAGEKLKSTTGWNEGANGSNSSGFNALPSGNRFWTGGFYSLGTGFLLWTSYTTEPNDWAIAGFITSSSGVNQEDYDCIYGFSVRCIKDE